MYSAIEFFFLRYVDVAGAAKATYLIKAKHLALILCIFITYAHIRIYNYKEVAKQQGCTREECMGWL